MNARTGRYEKWMKKVSILRLGFLMFGASQSRETAFLLRFFFFFVFRMNV